MLRYDFVTRIYQSINETFLQCTTYERHDIADILLILALNTNQSINESINIKNLPASVLNKKDKNEETAKLI